MEMLRRRFLGAIATLSAGGLASLAPIGTDGDASATKLRAGPRRVVTYAVQGFTCVTCAVGLEELLRREQGVLAAHADYPTATTRIEFDPEVVTDAKLLAFIQEAGFRVSRAVG